MGTIVASGQQSVTAGWGPGGAIDWTAQEITVLGAQLQADGARGGQIHIGGGWQGGGPLGWATQVAVSGSSRISASSILAGSGGEVVLWSSTETLAVGQLTARGGPQGGNGGRIEVSSKGRVQFGGRADAGAPKGRAGQFLLDPKYIVIECGQRGVSAV